MRIPIYNSDCNYIIINYKGSNMNPASYKLSKEVLQEMLEDEYNKKFHKFETIYDR